MASEGTAGEWDAGGEGSFGLPEAGPERSLNEAGANRQV